jgi:trehalose 6-phosphate synthase
VSVWRDNFMRDLQQMPSAQPVVSEAAEG